VLNAMPFLNPLSQRVQTPRFGNDNPGTTPPATTADVPSQDIPSHRRVGPGDVLEPTPVKLNRAFLGLIKKEDSRAGLKFDVWTVYDPRNSQVYSAFLDGGAEELEALYAKLSTWGVGTAVKVEGVASKPVSAQRNPFLVISDIQKL
jgi:hypothetical protein